MSVLQKIIAANDFINGGAIVYTTQIGEFKSRDPDNNYHNIIKSSGDLNIMFTGVNYYTN